MKTFDVSVEMCKTDRWGRWSEASLFMSTMINMQSLIRSNFLSPPSRWHRTKIRWRHDGIVGASRSHAPFLRQSEIFVFPSYCLLEANILDCTDEDGFTTALRSAKLAYEFNTQINLRIVFRQFLACQKLCDRSRSCCRSRGSYDGKRWLHEWPDVITIRSEFEHISLFVCPSDGKFGTAWRLQ
jgi:hypothetical protein